MAKSVKEVTDRIDKEKAAAELERRRPFEPEGSGYDYLTALQYGLGPDDEGHWPSRVPKTGQLLKGRGHPTWFKTEQAEKDAGYIISKGPDGRYYSRHETGADDVMFFKRDKLPGLFDNPNKQLDILFNEDLEQYLPMDVRYDFGKLKKVSKSAPDVEGKVRLSLLYQSIFGIPADQAYLNIGPINEMIFDTDTDAMQAFATYKKAYEQMKTDILDKGWVDFDKQGNMLVVNPMYEAALAAVADGLAEKTKADLEYMKGWDPYDPDFLPEQRIDEVIINALAKGIASMGSTYKSIAAAMETRPISPGPGPAPPAMTPEEKEWHEEITRDYKEDARILWEVATHPDLLLKNDDAVSKVIDIAVQTIPYIGSTTLAYLGIGPAGPFVVSAFHEGLSHYKQTIDYFTELNDGEPPTLDQQKKAEKIAMGVGVVSGAIESTGFLGAEHLLGSVSKKLTKKGIIGAGLTIGSLIESLEEGGQEISALVGEKMYRDVNWNEALKRVLSAMAGGFIVGGIFKGGGISANRLIAADRIEKFRQSLIKEGISERAADRALEMINEGADIREVNEMINQSVSLRGRMIDGLMEDTGATEVEATAAADRAIQEHVYGPMTQEAPLPEALTGPAGRLIPGEADITPEDVQAVAANLELSEEEALEVLRSIPSEAQTPVVEGKTTPEGEIAAPVEAVTEGEGKIKGLAKTTESGKDFETGKAVTFEYIRNTQKSPDMGERFQQHIEPAGKFMQTKPSTFVPMKNMISGEITFNNPLVIEFNTGTEKTAYDENNWKARLSKAFGNKTGVELSKAIADSGYDGIVTIGQHGETSEIVDLTSITPPAEAKQPTAEQVFKEAPEEMRSAGTRVQKMAAEQGIELDWDVDLTTEEFADIRNPEHVRAITESFGLTKKELADAIKQGKRYRIVGEETDASTGAGTRRSGIKIRKGATPSDIFHEFTHAVQRHTGEFEIEGTREQQAEEIAQKLAAGEEVDFGKIPRARPPTTATEADKLSVTPLKKGQKADGTTQIGSLPAFSLKEADWDLMDQNEIEATAVNRRLLGENKLHSILTGAVVAAPIRPTHKTGKTAPIPTPTDLLTDIYSKVKDGTYKKLLDRNNSPESLADERGLKGKARKDFITEVGWLRKSPLLMPVGEKPTSQLTDNTKTKLGVGFILGTCHPSASCVECYASVGPMAEPPAIRKHYRNTILILSDPKLWAQTVAKEAMRKSKVDLPFFRLLDVGDLTCTEMLKGFNELAKIMDRPLHIFSRHHDMLAKLKDGPNAPFMRMGSIDTQLFDHYGFKFLSENMKKRKIANAYLFNKTEDIERMKQLHDAGELKLILASKVELHEMLNPEMKISGCPCDAHDRPNVGSCKLCAMSQGGCYMAFSEYSTDEKGNWYKTIDVPAGVKAQPITQWFNSGAIPQAYTQIAVEIMTKSRNQIITKIRHYREGKISAIPVKDFRWPDDVFHIRENTKARTIKVAQMWAKVYKGIIEQAKQGSFIIKGGEIQPSVIYSKGKLVQSEAKQKRIMKKAQQLEAGVAPPAFSIKEESIYFPEQIGEPRRGPISKEGPGMTADEFKALPEGMAGVFKWWQTSGKKVGYKQGIKDQKQQIAQLQKRMKEKDAQIESVRKAMVAYFKENAPMVKAVKRLHPKAKMLSRVQNAKTMKDLEKAMDLYDKYSEQYTQAVLRSVINKVIKRSKPVVVDGIPRGRFTADVQNQLDLIRKHLDDDRTQVKAQMLENADKFDQAGGTMDYEELIGMQDTLMTAGIKGMDSKELQYVLDTINNLMETGRTLAQERAAKRKARIVENRQMVVDVLSGRKGLMPGHESISTEQLTANKTWVEKLFNWQYSWDTLGEKLSKFYEHDRLFSSPLSILMGRVHRADALEAEGVHYWMNEIKQRTMVAFNVNTESELNQALNRLEQEVTLGAHKNADGVEIPAKDLTFTRGQLIKRWMELLDPTLLATFEGYVIEDESGKQTKMGMRWSQEMINAVGEELTAEEKAYGVAQLQFYRDYYDSVNSVFRDHYGVDLPFNVFYSPIRRDVQIDIPEILQFAKEQMDFGSTRNGSLKTRQPNVRAIEPQDATSVLGRHIVQMEHFKAWTEIMTDLRSVFRNNEVRKTMLQYHGKPILNKVDELMNNMARGSVEKGKGWERYANTIRRNFTKSALARPLISPKQVISLGAYWSELSAGELITGVTDFWKNPVANFRTLRTKSGILKARWATGFERDIRFALQKDYVKKITGKAGGTDWFMAHIRAGDKFATMQGAWAVYQAGLKRGMNDADAIALAEDVTNRTQPSAELSTLAVGMQQGSLMKLLTMFMTQPNKYFQMIANNARAIRYGHGSPVEAMKNIFMAWVVLPMIFQLISDAFKWRTKRQLQTIILGPLNNLLVYGKFAQFMTGWAFDQAFGFQMSPTESTLDKSRYAVTRVTKYIDEGEPEDLIRAIEYFAEAGGALTGYPTPYIVQAERAIRAGKPAQFIWTEYQIEGPRKNRRRKPPAIRR